MRAGRPRKAQGLVRELRSKRAAYYNKDTRKLWPPWLGSTGIVSPISRMALARPATRPEIQRFLRPDDQHRYPVDPREDHGIPTRREDEAPNIKACVKTVMKRTFISCLPGSTLGSVMYL